MTSISASVARQTLPAQLDRVERGEEVEITRHGRIVAVLVHPEVLRARRAASAWSRADDVAARLQRAREAPLQLADIDADRVDELVETVRDERELR